MKTLIIIVIIIVVFFGILFTGFFIMDSIKLTESMKEENSETYKDVEEKSQLISALTKEIRELKEENEYLEEESQECESAYSQSWQSNTAFDWEVIQLKATNRDCIKGLEMCILELSKIISE